MAILGTEEEQEQDGEDEDEEEEIVHFFSSASHMVIRLVRHGIKERGEVAQLLPLPHSLSANPSPPTCGAVFLLV